jgi:hypothetical protein
LAVIPRELANHKANVSCHHLDSLIGVIDISMRLLGGSIELILGELCDLPVREHGNGRVVRMIHCDNHVAMTCKILQGLSIER